MRRRDLLKAAPLLAAPLAAPALAQANKELSRMGGHLATKNRRLQVRAKFFDALSAFQGDWPAAAQSTSVVLQRTIRRHREFPAAVEPSVPSTITKALAP